MFFWKHIQQIFPSEPQTHSFFRHIDLPIPMAVLVFVLSSIFYAGGAVPAENETVADCARIDNPEERLKCYDKLSGLKEVRRSQTYLSKLWELDENSPREKYAINPHRDNYALPFTSFNPSDDGLRKEEFTLQLSIKTKLYQDIGGKKMDLWFGYTQRSFWQLYDTENSSPFRETNYEPEILLNFRTDFKPLGLRFINVGLNHQSNGCSEPNSRSWNRGVANFGFEKDNLVLVLNTWLRIPESDESDDNSDIERYMGYGQAWIYYFFKFGRQSDYTHRLGFMFRNNLLFDNNRSSVQLEGSFQVLKNTCLYIQYYSGYGESLIDYDEYIDRIGAGVMLKPW